MFGKALNTLRYQVYRELQSWRSTNKTLHENSWPWYHRLLISSATHPVRAPLLLFFIASLLSIAAVVFSPCNPSQSDKTIEEAFATLWTIQVTIAAMIYPIVIGFVSLLLQRRHSAKASLHVYLHDSSALLTGISALLLISLMGIQFLIIRLTNLSGLRHWLTIDGIWFLSNIIGVIWFLIRTFDYLRPERRADIVRIYAINHLLPIEIRNNLEYERYFNAIEYGWLPGPPPQQTKNKPSILLGPYGREEGKIQISAPQAGNHKVVDIRFRILSLAIRMWQRKQTRSIDALSPTIIIPISPGAVVDNKAGLCRTKGGLDVNWIERRLIRSSIVLTRFTKETPILSTTDILNDRITEVLVAMEAGEDVAFHEALKELIETHAGLIMSGDCLNRNKTRYNYAALTNPSDVFKSQIHDAWAREYHRLFETTIEKLSSNNNYFNKLIHTPTGIIYRIQHVRPTNIPTRVLRLTISSFFLLNRWWSKAIAERGLSQHNACNPTTLPPTTNYDTSLLEFIGAWEHLTHSAFLPNHEEHFFWSNYKEITSLFSEHLEGTLHMLFNSVMIGNKEGAEWICDTLVKWWHTAKIHSVNIEYYVREPETLTLDILYKPWEEAKASINISPKEIDEEKAQKSIWAACIRNYWIDLCCLAVYALLILAKDCKRENNLPACLASSLMRGTALREGNLEIGGGWPVTTLDDWLIAIIRQRHLNGNIASGYYGKIANIVGSISNQRTQSMVSGRIYAGGGFEDLDTLIDGQLLVLCLFSTDNWQPSRNLMDAIARLELSENDRLNAFRNHLDRLTKEVDKCDHKFIDISPCIKEHFSADKTLQDHLAILKESFDLIIEHIKKIQKKRVAQAPISKSRLHEIEGWFSTSRLKTVASPPLSLFHHIGFEEKHHTEHSLCIQNMERTLFIDTSARIRPVNEREWFEKTVHRNIAISVMAEILKKLQPDIASIDSPSAYWRYIKREAKEQENYQSSLALLVANRASPPWLFEPEPKAYGEQDERANNFHIIHERKYTDHSYIGSVDGIPIYITPVPSGSSYLISRSVLDALYFTKYENDVFIKTSTEEVAKNKELVHLVLSWRFHIDLKKGRFIELRYTSEQEKE